jgi:hypothetical protein
MAAVMCIGSFQYKFIGIGRLGIGRIWKIPITSNLPMHITKYGQRKGNKNYFQKKLICQRQTPS